MSSEKMVLTPEQIGEGIPAILQIGQAHFTSQCLYTMAKLGVPDIIGNKALSVEQVAAALPGSPNRDALGRCLRVLALSGIFAESAGPEGEFVYALTPAGALLQTGAPQPSMACGMLHWMEKPLWGAWSELSDYVAGTTSTCPFETFNGAHVFNFYKEHPESAAPFNEFMSFFSAGELPIVLEHVDWEAWAGKKVVDVGGSQGAVMAAVADKFHDVYCISFDLPEVIEASGTPPKGVVFAKGDMFDPDTIPKGDVIFMKHILHDWDDKSSIRILTSCHEALPDDGKLIIAESVLPKPGEATPANIPAMYLDLLMLVFNGKERTQKQWEELARSANWKIESITPTPGPTCQILLLAKV